MSARVVGISGDSVEDLRKFRDTHQLNFPLLSDVSHDTLNAYGVWQGKNMHGKEMMGTVRTTFILGPDGTIRQIFPKVKVEGHIHQVLAALRS